MNSVIRGLIAGGVGTIAYIALTDSGAVVAGAVSGRIRPRAQEETDGGPHGYSAEDGQESRDINAFAVEVPLAGAIAGVLAGMVHQQGQHTHGLVGDAVVATIFGVARQAACALTGKSGGVHAAGRRLAADALPCLAFGIAARATLRALPMGNGLRSNNSPNAALVGHALMMGAAVGARSAFGAAASELAAEPPAVSSGMGKLAAAALLTSELVFDKMGTTGSRLAGPPLAARIIGGACSGSALAHQQGAAQTAPVLAGAFAAVAGAHAGSAWRTIAARYAPDWIGAVVEDSAALALAALAYRGGRLRA